MPLQTVFFTKLTSLTKQMLFTKQTSFKKLLILSSLVGITACTSTNKDTFFEEEHYAIDDVVQTNSAIYECDNSPLAIFFHAEQAHITWKEKAYQLNHAVSASGSHYLGEGISFWIHEDEAELTFRDVDKVACHLIRVNS